MLRPFARPASVVGLSCAASRRRLFSTGFGIDAKKEKKKISSDPLRILFCGSDAFSCASLHALHEEHRKNRRLVESLDVMVLPAKRTGRGFKQIREVPCKSVAEQLGLKIHQRETFREWELPDGINLIVVVSFGLFVPRRILQGAKYGGLNVHPSLLPDLRGPAPIHHAMLRGDTHVGISLQTLDDKAFDHGAVLAQTPAPGLPIPSTASIQQLTTALGAAGAEMLVQGLCDGLHVPPHKDAGWMSSRVSQEELTHAPKVGKADSQISWSEWTAEDFQRRMRVFSAVWTWAVPVKGNSSNKKGELVLPKRILFQDAEVVVAPDVVSGGQGRVQFLDGPGGITGEEKRHGGVVVMRLDESKGCCFIQTMNGAWIRVTRVKVDGKPEQAAASALRLFFEAQG